MQFRRNGAEHDGAEHDARRHLADDRRLPEVAQHEAKQPRRTEDDHELKKKGGVLHCQFARRS